MFYNCSSLNGFINFTTTSALTNVSYMFYGCIRLIYTPSISVLTGVTDMSYMFYNCSSLNDVIFFTTTKALTNVSYMFYGCIGLTSTPSISLLTGVTDMSYMFYGCSSLYLSPYTTYNIILQTSTALTNLSNMFNGCTIFNTSVTISNTYSVTDMSYMFYGCNNFNQPINFGTGIALTNISYMFTNCTALNSSVILANTSNVTNMSYMFKGCNNFNYPVKLNISSIPSGQTGNLNNGLFDMFRNTGLSVQNYSTILNYFTYNTIPFYLNLGTVSNSVNKLIPHSTTSVYSILTSSPNYWSITDGGTNSFTINPSVVRYNPLQIKNTNTTISSTINDSIVLENAYNTCQINTTGMMYNTNDTTPITATYNNMNFINCIGNTLNVGNDFTTINIGTSVPGTIIIGTSTPTNNIENIIITGDTINSTNGSINMTSTTINMTSTIINMTPTTINMTPTTLNINPTTFNIFNQKFILVNTTSYTPSVSNGACTNLFGSYSVIGTLMFLKIWGNTSVVGTAGTSGIYAFSIPSGYSIATTTYSATPTPTNGYIVSANSTATTFGGTTVGSGIIQQGSTSTSTMVVLPYSTTQICGYSSSNSTASTNYNYHCYNWYPFNTTNMSFSYDCILPLV